MADTRKLSDLAGIGKAFLGDFETLGIRNVAQAKDPNLPAGQRQWWYWSRVRKARAQ